MTLEMAEATFESGYPFRDEARVYCERTGPQPGVTVTWPRRSRGFLLLGLTFLLVSSVTLNAERLPIKAYTNADGLPHNMVIHIVEDSRGFLWFCTLRGLARFDGYSFTNYGAEQGLPGQITDLLETRTGDYWVGASTGLYQFRVDPRHSAPAQPMFRLYHLTTHPGALRVYSLRQDHQGFIWVATNSGLYRFLQTAEGTTPQLVDLATPGRTADRVQLQELYEDRQGAMWACLVGSGLRRLWPDGHLEYYTASGSPLVSPQETTDENSVGSILEDHEGRFWLGSAHGLALLLPQPGSNRLALAKVFTTKNGLRDDRIQSLLETSDGTVWVGTNTGLSEFCPASLCGTDMFRSSVSPSLGRTGAWTLAEDKAGNLWMGNETGAFRIARDGFRTYDEADGLGSSSVRSLFEDHHGDLYVVTEGPDRAYINQLGGNRFASVLPRLPRPQPNRVTSLYQPVLLDHYGEWWVATGKGFFRYGRIRRLDDLAHRLPIATYTTRDGLPEELITKLYEDATGNVWIGSYSISAHSGSLTRWNRSTKTFYIFGPKEGLTPLTGPNAFSEDGMGDLWVGFRFHDLARYRAGRFTVFTTKDGLPAGSIMNLYLDHEGRLWVATMDGGVARIDRPQDEHPVFVKYSTAEGLSSNQVEATVEDQSGYVYLLTDLSVDRLDPKTGAVKHYTSADSPLSSHAGVAFRDHNNALWFGTLQGISRLVPKSEEPAVAPPIRISAIRVRGEAQAISELGEMRLTDLVLQPNQNQVEIEFSSLSFSPGEKVRYQYKLERADRDWSTISERRTVNYATLSPGRYRFLVRAVNWQGLTSAAPAEVDFRVQPPLWQRWWVQSLLGLLVLSGAYAFYRFRLARLLELERIRTRIATDLHDDIGSSLTQISILSEVVRQKVGRDGQAATESLARIAELSRELVDSMSDIVWAVNPNRDRVGDLAHRMRRFASDVLDARSIEMEFHEPATTQRELRADRRRQIFLVFKESLNNVARHAACKRVTIELAMEGSHLLLRVSDDGIGFDTTDPNGGASPHPGHGLRSMTNRAISLGGQLSVTSQVGHGTTVTLRVPA